MKNTLLVFFFILSVSQAFSQKYIFRQYSVDDGLAQSQVRAICQGEKGNLWVGTASGLSKFNGREFVNYSTSDGLVDMQVNAIFNGKDGGVWVVTNKGLTNFNNKKVSKIDLTQVLSEQNINDATEDSKGGVWLAVYKKGVVFLPQKTSLKVKDYNLLDDKVSSIITFSDNQVITWGSQTSLFKYNTLSDSFEIVRTNNEEYVEVVDAFKKGKDSVYILSPQHVRLLTKDTIIDLNNYTVPVIDLVKDIIVDSEKNIWVSSVDGLHKLMPDNSIIHYSQQNGLPFQDIRCTYNDIENNIWIGTDGGGLLKFYSQQEFVTYKKDDGYPSEQIMSVAQYNDEMWFSTYSEGVFRVKDDKITVLTERNGLSSNTVWSSCVDKKGNIWFGTSRGLSIYNGHTFQNLSIEEGLASNRVTSLFEDNQGRMWAGGKDGINIFYNGKNVRIIDTLGFSGYRTRSIVQDKGGTIWLGSKNGIFYTKNGAEFRQELASDSIAINTDIYSVLPVNRALLIASSTGLHHYNLVTKKITEIILSKKYFSNSVNFFVSDPNNKNTYWAGRNDGVYLLNLEINQDGEIVQYNTKRYSRYNGIDNLETNQNSAFFDSNGNLWFGTGMGIVKKIDVKIPTNVSDFNPELSINSFLLFLQPPSKKDNIFLDEITGLPKNLVLKFNQNHVTFGYEAISLSNPDGFVYRYKLVGLEGFEDEWSPITKSTSATFSNLSHGDYTFMVQTSSLEGKDWSEPVVFSFQIKPPFWLTPWFIILSISFVLSLSFLTYWIRMKSIKQKREAEQIMYKNKLLSLEQQSLNSSMNRHFIFNALNSIQYYINTHDRLSANKYLTSFAKLIRKNLESTNAHNNMTTLRDEIDRIQLYLSLEAMRFPDKITYDINIQPSLDIDSISIPPMFFQPYIENSIWHGILPKEKGHVQINIFKDESNQLSITIEDNGIGVSESKKNKNLNTQSHDSKGVEITKRRIDLLEKFINKKINVVGPIDTFDDKNMLSGTKVEIKLPVDNETFM